MLAAATLVITIGACSARPPTWSPDGSRLAIAYGGHLFEVAVDGSGVTQLSREVPAAFDTGVGIAAWSPDGADVAFERADGIWVMNLATWVGRPLAQGSAPAWSPDGAWIAYRHWSGDIARLAITRPDGSGNRDLSRGSITYGSPAWSPDGRWLVVQREDAAADGSLRSGGLSVFDITTGAEHQLTGQDDADSDPSWSPDGHRIAFSRYPGHLMAIDLDADPGPPVVLSPESGESFDSPRWSPNGQWVAAVRSASCPGEDRCSIVWLVSADGGVSREIPGTTGAVSVMWSPDGKSIAYVETTGTIGRLWVVGLDGGHPRLLGESPTLGPSSLSAADALRVEVPRGLLTDRDEASIVLGQRPIPALIELGSASVDPLGLTIAEIIGDIPPGEYDAFLMGNGAAFTGPIWLGTVTIETGGPAPLSIILVLAGLVMPWIRLSGRAAATCLRAGALLLIAVPIWHLSWAAGLILLGVGILGFGRTGPFAGRAMTRRTARLAGVGAVIAGLAMPLGTVTGLEAPAFLVTMSIAWPMIEAGLVLLAVGSAAFGAAAVASKTAVSRVGWLALVGSLSALVIVASPVPDTLVASGPLANAALAVAWLAAVHLFSRVIRVPSGDGARRAAETSA
jgi:Tol biopolymer transport system component